MSTTPVRPVQPDPPRRDRPQAGHARPGRGGDRRGRRRDRRGRPRRGRRAPDPRHHGRRRRPGALGRDRRRDRRRRGRARHRHDRPHLPAARRRQDRAAQQAPAALRATTSRWPTRPASHGSARRSHEDPDKAFQYTIKRNTVAVVTDGTAVLGLGDIGPAAAMPVMEGKAMLFKEFAGVDAFPICLDTKDPDEIVETVTHLAPGFGGINLEDISAPRCFEIEERLDRDLDIPVFHDDQHGTAIVVLAALMNACKLTGRELRDLRVLVTGLGAAGVAVTKILLDAGVRHVVGADSRGVVSTEREDYRDGTMNAVEALVRGGLQPRAPHRPAGRRHRRHGPLHRAVRRARHAGRGAGPHGPRRDGLRDGQPDPGGLARGGRARTCASWPRAARTTPTRSTTSWPSPASSAARSTSAPPASPTR